MGHIDERDAHLLLDTLQLVLHILPQPEIQRAQRLVQQQHLGAVHQRPGDGHPLLLSAGELVNAALFKALQADHLQHFRHPLLHLVLGHLGDAQAEGDVLKHVQMGKQGVFLEHGVDLPLMRRNVIDPHTVKGHITGCGRGKPTDDPQRGGLAAPAGPKQREEFGIVDVKIDVVENQLVVKRHAEIPQANQLFGHLSSPVHKKDFFASSLCTHRGPDPADPACIFR